MRSLPENMCLNQAWWFQIYQRNFNVFGRTYLFLRLVFLLSRDLLVATFKEKRAPTFKKNVAEQGIVMPNWSKTFQDFLLYKNNRKI